MARELVKGRSRKEVEKRIAYMKGRGWNPVSEIKEDPTYHNPVYVCVMENKSIVSNANNWGNQYHLE